MSSVVRIRSLEQSDFPSWLPLWDGNNQGIKNEKVTTETWARLMDPNFPIHGFGAFEKDQMVGIVQYVVHPTTGSIEPVAYMQDVYVDPTQRQKGIARKLVQKVSEIGHQEKWARLYWLAEADNEAAQALYKNIGVKLNFTLHVMKVV